MKMSSTIVGLALSLSVFAAKVEIDVNGMTCGMCVEAITKELKATDKAENISVNLDEKKARFSEIKDKKIKQNSIY
jgi:copper chaperone CopZ